jgi:beta-glucanase (GH16 family)
MKLRAFVVAAGLIPFFPLIAGTGSEVLPVQGYRLVWSDEFEGSSLDTSKWDFRCDSKMWSRQKPSNISVRDGKLILALKKEKDGKMEYTGGGVISKRSFLYGYYEARLKVPPGAGWHTSFWMMKHDGKGGTGSSESRQELDVCENDSVNPCLYGVNVHRWNPKPHLSIGHKTIPSPDLSKDFHIFGCEFTPEQVTYFLDGKAVQTVPATEFPHGEQNIWLTSIASWLGKTKAVDDACLPASAEFDYVRFYQKLSDSDFPPIPLPTPSPQ